ncbi:amino acid ABC transporter substrate-binding protein [Paracoccus suum]|uniref:Amino acid ABC transporter substrate-binding protein n=1 Tax=Paracoccus suum TaxID=2259340 RepID=A0A344PLD0_9RHOB|nr:ABC transporter substrate-binding protein [Paracoccus suum]AXC50185.1 amino acid ABC transporter substrate-binding protein [Paracoccus suum]
MILRRISSLAATLALGTALAVGSGPALAQSADHPDDQKLMVAFDVGFAPFAFKEANGQITGFSYDFAEAIAKQLGRPGIEVADVNFSSIFAGLFSKRYEMVAAPANITEARAKEMLFAEPYMPTGLGVLVKKGGKVAGLEDLSGKIVTVNNGSTADKWAGEHEKEYGFTVQRFNKNADGVQAVMMGRAFANIADEPVSHYVTTQTPMAEVPFVIDTGNDFGLTFRKDDTEFRNRVDVAIECLKKDGTLAAIYKKWFGTEPEQGKSVTTIYPGYGAPNFDGYDATEHEPECK